MEHSRTTSYAATDIAVVGLACRFPGKANDEKGFLDLLLKGESAYSKVPRERFNVEAFHREASTHVGDLIPEGGHYLTQDVSAFDAPFFAITAEEARAMDPAARMLLESTYEAFENAGIPIKALEGSNTGCYVGCFTKDYHELLMADPEAAPMYSGTGTGFSLLANRISWYYDLKGPSISLDTACSSSLVGLHLACQSLSSGETNMALVSGANLILAPNLSLWLSNLQMVSPEGLSRAFAHDVKGYGRGEGIATVVLKPLETALRDGDHVRAVIKGTGVNQDGRSSSITVPNPRAQADLIRSTYRSAALDFAEVGYFEAHGTGTAKGDTIELLAISNVIDDCKRTKPLLVGSVKSNIGHLEGAAGIAGIIKSIIMLENGIIFPNIHLDKLNGEIPFANYNIEIPTEIRPWPKDLARRASVNSFGYGGTNAHVILEASPSTPQDDTKPSVNGTTQAIRLSAPRLFVFSGRTAASVARVQEQYLAHVSRSKHLPDSNRTLDGLAYTLASRRSHLNYKLFHIASSLTELEGSLLNNPRIPVKALRGARVGLIFTGQGAQWPGMGLELMQYPIFRASIQRAESYLLAKCSCSWSLIAELSKPKEVSKIGRPEIAQPLCTVVQVAMVDLVRSWGVSPVAVAGHSSGEIAAAYCVGAIDDEEAWQIAFHRGRVCQQLVTREPRTKGAMIAVGLGTAALTPYLDSLITPGHAGAACLNSPSSVTVSGDSERISELLVRLQADGVFARKLPVEVAYHSPHMLTVAGLYLDSISHIRTRTGRSIGATQMISSVTGKATDLAELTPEYWVRNLVSPVLFSAAVQNMLRTIDGSLGSSDAAVDVLLEIGPHSTLEGPIRQILVEESLTTIGYTSMLQRSQDAALSAMNMAAQLHLLGVPIDITAVNQLTTGSDVLTDLPGYPWDRSQKYWAVSRLTNAVLNRKFPRHDLLGTEMPGSDRLHTSWRLFPNRQSNSWIRDHVIHGSDVYPAAAFLAMVIEAALQLRQTDREVTGVHLRHVRILKALVIPESEHDTEAITRLWRMTGLPSDEEQDSWRFSVYCTRETGEVEEHAVGSIYAEYKKVTTFGASGSDRVLSSKLSEYSGHLDSKLWESDPATFYKAVGATGISYGPRFQLISKISGSPGACCWKISTPQRESFESKYVVHPTTLDSVIHSVFAALHRVGDLKTAAMPVSFGHVFVSTDSALTESKEISGFTTAVRSDQRQVVANAYGFSANKDKIVIQVEDLQCTEVPAQRNYVEHEQPAPLGSVVLKPDIAFLSDQDLLTYALAVGDDDSSEAGCSRVEHKAIERITELAAFKNPSLSILQCGGRENLLIDILDAANKTNKNCSSTTRLTILSQDSVTLPTAPNESLSESLSVTRLPFDSEKPFSVNVGEGEDFDLIVVSHSTAATIETRRVEMESLDLLKTGGRLVAIQSKDAATRTHDKLCVTDNDSSKTVSIRSLDKSGGDSVRLRIGTRYPHPTASGRRMHIVHALGDQDIATKVRDQLPGTMIETVAWPPNVEDLQGSFVISLMELSGPLLSTIDSGDFETLQRIALQCSGLLWVCSGRSDPHMGVAPGWLRVLQNENPEKTYQYLLLDDLSESDVNARATTIASVAMTESHEKEFSVIDGRVMIPRWRHEPELSQAAFGTVASSPSSFANATPSEETKSTSDTATAPISGSEHATIISRQTTKSPLSDDEVSVDLVTIVLNDSDLDLPGGLSLREGVGTISTVGNGITRLGRGDLVSFFFEGQLSRNMIVKHQQCQKVSTTASKVDAAPLAVTFATALRVIERMVHLQSDDLVLIQGGGSDMGRSLIILAKSTRARMICTAKTSEEAAVIADLGVPSDDIFKESDPDLWSAMRAMTKGHGLSALICISASEWLFASLVECLAPTGILVDTSREVPGIRDRDLGDFPFASQESQPVSDPAQQYLAELAQLSTHYRIFSANDIAEALKHHRDESSHEGTILTFNNDDILTSPAMDGNHSSLDSHATYVLAGGLGGLGRSLAKFLASQGARNIVFLSRSGPSSAAAKSTTAELTALGVNLETWACDIGDAESLAAALVKCAQTMPPIKGVIQLAAVIRDAIFDNYSHDDWRANLYPKVQGSWNLHRQLPSTLDFFIMLGSISGIIGNRGQAGYASGNTFQDFLSHHRRRQGLPSITIDLGAMADVGMITDGTATASLSTSDVVWMKEAELERIIALCIQDATSACPIPAQVCTGLPSGGRLQKMRQTQPIYFERPFFAALKALGISNRAEDSEAASTPGKETAVERLIFARSVDEVHACVVDLLIARLATNLGIKCEDIDFEETLATYGIDSLKVLDLRNWMKQTMKAQLSFFQILDTSKSIRDLVRTIVQISEITVGLQKGD